MKKSAIVLFAALLSISAFAQSVQEGVNHLYAERYVSAKAIFDKMLAANPNNLEAVYWLGQTYIEQDDVASARALYEKTLAANGNAPLVLVGMGHVELLDGKAPEARQRFESAISLSRGKKGDDPNVLSAIGRANVDAKTGDIAYAIEKLSAAVAAAPNNTDILLNLGNAYRKKLDGGQAVTAYTKATQVNPKFARAFYRMAKLYETQRNWDIYQDNLNKAIQADPKFAPAYQELYYYNLLYAKDNNKAQSYADQFIANTDPSINNDYLKAQTFFVQKDYDQAISISKNILAQAGDKTNYRVYRLLSYSYLEKGDTAAARSSVDQLFAKAKEDDLVGNDYVLKADVYAKDDPSVIVDSYIAAAKMDSVYANQVKFIQQGIDKYEAAGQKEYVGELKLALYKLNPNPNPASLVSLGIPFYQSGQFQRADSLFQAYSTAEPDSIYGHLWSARSRGRIDSTMEQGLAMTEYEQLLRVAGTDKVRFKAYGSEAAANLASYYVNVKKEKDKGIDYLQKALEFDPENEGFKKNIQILQRPAPQPRTAPAKKSAAKSKG
ncbi:MAG TPA: tetratricopeptide repeat protein [Chitinophagaceae bacterium]|nr:tetratricopeptide repeat protein [Chitinophagaceae bacterium]